MNALAYVMLGFSLLGALDRILGNKFGLGKEFEKGFELLGTLALSMIGMIVLTPWASSPPSFPPLFLPMTWAAPRCQWKWRRIRSWEILTPW